MATAKTKIPTNLHLKPRIRDLGERLAEADHRTLSEEVQWLIEAEAVRRKLNGAVKNATSAG